MAREEPTRQSCRKNMLFTKWIRFQVSLFSKVTSLLRRMISRMRST